MVIPGQFGFRSWMSLIFGVILSALGLIPLLNSFKVIGWSIPELPLFAIRIILIIAGILLLWDSTYEIWQARAWWILSIVFGIPILILGVVPILNQYGVLSFTLDFIPQMVLNILTFLAGFVLIIDAWKAE